MPILGKFYTAQELQELLGISKQAISNMARRQNWPSFAPGLYPAERVEWELMDRGIDPDKLPVRTFGCPEGPTRDES